MTKTRSAQPRYRPRNTWGILAAVAMFLGAAIAFWSASATLDRGTTPDELQGLINTWVMIGILVTGIATLMRASSHGSKQSIGKLVDGGGKTLGVFGWSLALVGSATSAMKGGPVPNWVISLAVATVMVSATVTLAISMLPARKEAR